MSTDTVPFSIEEWREDHPRRSEIWQFVASTAPEQLPFARGEYDRLGVPHHVVALENGELAGVIRFVEQPTGPEAK